MVEENCRTQPNKLTTDIHPLAHVRHCIDLLRNSIMCRPDLTIEIKNEKLGGVTGFGTEHQCKDWAQLLSWVSGWEDYH